MEEKIQCSYRIMSVVGSLARHKASWYQTDKDALDGKKFLVAFFFFLFERNIMRFML